jgi:hypothetical protein
VVPALRDGRPRDLRRHAALAGAARAARRRSPRRRRPGGGYRWERRRLDVPSIAYTFAFGEFDVEHRRVGDVDVSLAFARDSVSRPSEALRADALDAVASALGYFERTFGAYPLDELSLVTVARPFSQSYLGFVTLAESILTQPEPLSEASRWQRRTTIAHELAHQWWGNLVGWWSYRDQWLSEGMANYSALLHDSWVEGSSDRLATMSAGWRESLSQTTAQGRTLESLGPIVLGNRLNSSQAADAYRTIVYRKGAVVLAMLARAVGEERFIEMLHALVAAAANEVVTTEGFLEAMERMSGLDLEGFARQYVYGTGIPEVYYLYDPVREADGRWTVQGRARLLSAPRYGYRVVRTSDGRLDVLRTAGQPAADGPTTLMVPYRVTIGGAEAPRELAVHDGQLFLEGRQDAFRIETETQPVDLRLDPRGEILAWFYSERRHPKRVLRYEAAEFAMAGRLDEAEARYLDALARPADAQGPVDPLGPAIVEPRIDGPTEDLNIRLALVRLALERGDDAVAQEALATLESSLAGDERDPLRMERDVLQARLEIRRGDHARAHRRLERVLRSVAPARGGERPWQEVLRQLRLSAERLATVEAFALFALVSHELEEREDLAWALREARDRGADMSALAGAPEPAPG